MAAATTELGARLQVFRVVTQNGFGQESWCTGLPPSENTPLRRTDPPLALVDEAGPISEPHPPQGMSDASSAGTEPATPGLGTLSKGSEGGGESPETGS